MFADANFDGRVLSMSPGDAVSFRSGQYWNDRASSARVARGCVLIAYSDNRMQGRVIEIDRNVRNLKSMGWNDRISSAQCDCPY